MTAMPKLRLSDLRLGMEVYLEQLSDIYDTWIFVEENETGDKKGVIRFIGKETNDESQKVWHSCKVLAPIFHDSMELEEDAFFNE